MPFNGWRREADYGPLTRDWEVWCAAWTASQASAQARIAELEGANERLVQLANDRTEALIVLEHSRSRIEAALRELVEACYGVVPARIADAHPDSPEDVRLRDAIVAAEDYLERTDSMCPQCGCCSMMGDHGGVCAGGCTADGPHDKGR